MAAPKKTAATEEEPEVKKSKAELLEEGRIAAMEKPSNETAQDRMREVYAKRGRKS